MKNEASGVDTPNPRHHPITEIWSMKMNPFRYLGNRLIPIDDLLCAYPVKKHGQFHAGLMLVIGYLCEVSSSPVRSTPAAALARLSPVAAILRLCS